MTPQPSQVILINGFGVLFVIFNAFGLGLRLPVGKMLAEAFAHRKIAVWALVINFVIIPLLFIGYLLTIASSIPGEIKVEFCVAALCAGMPFAPIVARLAKANVSIATTLLVVLAVATTIALPLELPLAIDAVDVQLKTLSEILLGRCCFSCSCLWFWGVASGSGGPTWRPIGTVDCPGRNFVSAFKSQLHPVCVLESVRADVGHRELHRGSCWPVHRPWVAISSFPVSASKMWESGMRPRSPAIRNIAPMLLMMIFPFVAYPLVTVSITILNNIGLTIVLLFVLMWRRAAPPSGADATTNQTATAEEAPKDAAR
jgi:bile acid:Na+ symporter, BASS family